MLASRIRLEDKRQPTKIHTQSSPSAGDATAPARSVVRRRSRRAEPVAPSARAGRADRLRCSIAPTNRLRRAGRRRAGGRATTAGAYRVGADPGLAVGPVHHACVRVRWHGAARAHVHVAASWCDATDGSGRERGDWDHLPSHHNTRSPRDPPDTQNLRRATRGTTIPWREARR